MTVRPALPGRLARAALLVTLILLPGGLAAQEAEEEKPAPTAPSAEELAGRLKAALDRAEDAAFLVRGSLELGDSGSPFGAVMVASTLGGGPPFEGKFEAWSDGGGKLVVVSERLLPGFEAFRSDEREITRLTYEERAENVGQLMSDLGALLDMSRVRKWLKRADLEARFDPTTGVTSFTGEAPRRLVPAGSGGVMGMAQEKILRIHVSVEIGKTGELATAVYEVHRSDPMAAMIKRSPFGEMEEEPKDEGDVEKGKTTTYRLTFEAADPSPRVRTFLRAAESLIKQEVK
ncbi:MAG: hypothetical protein ACYTDY_04180 [Planctomycetota bacterium]|jgi:hypothetical protein